MFLQATSAPGSAPHQAPCATTSTGRWSAPTAPASRSGTASTQRWTCRRAPFAGERGAAEVQPLIAPVVCSLPACRGVARAGLRWRARSVGQADAAPRSCLAVVREQLPACSCKPQGPGPGPAPPQPSMPGLRPAHRPTSPPACCRRASGPANDCPKNATDSQVFGLEQLVNSTL